MLKMRGCPRYDADGDGGGGITTKQFEDLGDTMTKIATDHNEMKESVEVSAAKVEKIMEDYNLEMNKIGGQIASVRNQLAGRYGVSGSQDWLNEFSKFLSGAFWHSKTGKTPDNCLMSDASKAEDFARTITADKAVIDFTTEAGTTQYLLPTLLRPGVIDLKDLFGGLYPLFTRASVPAGQTVQINREAAKPVATWRATQLSAITQEATPMAFAQDSVSTDLLGTFIQISNEMLANPSVNFAAIAAAKMVRAILTKLETDIISCDGSGEPSAGILAATNVNDQGNMATATFSNVVQFLQACLVDNDTAFNPQWNKIFMTPTDALSLASEAVGAAELVGMLVWGNPRTGIPTTLLGYELVIHPAMTATNRYMMVGDPTNVFLFEDAAFGIDISPHATAVAGAASAFIENASVLRVLNHYDWSVGQPDEWHFTTVGA